MLPLRIAAACPQLRIDALDLSEQMIDRARHTAAANERAQAVTFTVADVAELPFQDASFDLLVSTVSQQSPLEGTSRLNPIGRLVLRTAPICPG